MEQVEKAFGDVHSEAGRPGHDKGEDGGHRVEDAGSKGHGQPEQQRHESCSKGRRVNRPEDGQASRERRACVDATSHRQGFVVAPGLGHSPVVRDAHGQVAFAPHPDTGWGDREPATRPRHCRAPDRHVAALVEATFRECSHVAAGNRNGCPGLDSEAGRLAEADRAFRRLDVDFDVDIHGIAVSGDPAQDCPLVGRQESDAVPDCGSMSI